MDKKVLGTFLCVAALFSAGACSRTEPVEASGNGRKIAYYKKKIAEYPGHYPAHARLAGAYLERAAETGDASDVGLARLNARKSIEIQPNFQAYKTLARIEGFAHRFIESLTWAEKASKASPDSGPDSELASIMADAYLGLGEDKRAADLLGTFEEKDFFISAAFGHLFKSRGNPGDAATAFQDAARFALAENAIKARVWAEVMTAGVWLDSGAPDKALRFLETAERLSSSDKQVMIHRAEYYLAKNKPEKAAAIYRSLLAKRDHPDIHDRLYLLERNLGNQRVAKQHFDAAEAGYGNAVERGEIYTLGALARLLCNAGLRLETAQEYASANLLYKKDEDALGVRACVEGKLAKELDRAD